MLAALPPPKSNHLLVLYKTNGQVCIVFAEFLVLYLFVSIGVHYF
jgi:hypothetical protein